MEGLEGSNDWEQIESPGSQISPPSAQSRHWAATVIRDDFYDTDRSVFPPDDHEGLRISPQHTPPQPDSPSPSISPLPPAQGFGGRLWSHFRVLTSGILQIASGFQCYAADAGGFRAFAPAAGGAVTALLLSLSLSLFCLWVHRWRRLREEEKNRLLVLLKEKDQKISQLLLQIAKMGEMFSAHRRVPVIRIGGMIEHGQPA